MSIDAFDICGNKEYTVFRAVEGSYIDGVYAIAGGDPERVGIKVKANVQANKSQKIQMVQDASLESRDLIGQIKIYSNDKLFTHLNNPLRRADIMLYDDRLWEVRQNARWDQLAGLEHFKSIAFLYKDDIDEVVEFIKPFLPTLVLARADLCALVDVPADTEIITDAATPGVWDFSGNVIFLGTGPSVFNTDLGLEIRLNDIEQEKGCEVFWVASNKIKFNFDIKAGEAIIIKKFNI